MAQLIKDIITTSGVDTYTGNLKTKYAEYQHGLYMVKIGSTNTGDSTLNIDGLGAIPMVDISGNPLSAGALPAGSSFVAMYDGTNFIMYGVETTTDTNFAVGDLIFTADRTHDFSGHTLSFVDSTMAGSNFFNLDLTDSGSGLDLELTDSSGAFSSFLVNTGQLMYSVDDGSGRTGLIEVNNGYSSIQVSDYLGSYPGSGGFIAHGRQFQILGEAVFKSIEATDDTILSSDFRWYPYVISGVLRGRYRASGGGLSDIFWDNTKITPGTNGQFMKTASGVSGWANITYSDITGAPTVSGTTNRMAKFTGASTVGNSQIIDTGTQISINGGSTFSNVLFNVQVASGYDAMAGFLNSNGSPVGSASYGVISGAIGTGSVNVGGWFYAANGTNYSVQLQDGTQGAGKFLKSITSDGKANWANLSYSDLSSMTSANLASLLTDETGTGSVVFSNSPTLVTPVLGTATATQITVAADPTLAMQVATKQYVDNLVAGLKFKQDVVAASTANVSVSSAPSTLDGVTLVSGDRVLLKNQTTATENGCYQFNGAGSALTRTTDADTGAELVSATFPVRGGTVNQDTWFTVTNDAITIGSTNITFTQTGGAGTYAAGTGLSLTGNTFSIDSTVATLNGSQNLQNKTLTAPTINGGSLTLLTTLGIKNAFSSNNLLFANLEPNTADRALNITVNDATRTFNLAGNLSILGNNITFTATGATSVTLPTSGTLYGTATGSITSAQLLNSISDETGTGSLVFNTSPTFVTPILGTPTSVTLTNATGLPLTTGVTGTLGTANGGTGLTSFTSGGIVYASSTSALTTSSGLTYSGGNFSVNGLVTGRGGLRMNGTVAGNPLMYNVADQTGNLVVEMGRQDNAASVVAFDFNTGSTSVDYDFRMQASGGNGTVGGGTLNFLGANFQFNGNAITTNVGTSTLQNKTITNSNNVLGGVTMTLGSDATGDLYYRNVSGVLTRLGIGPANTVLTSVSGLPSWQTNTPASSSNTGTQVWKYSYNGVVNNVLLLRFCESWTSSSGHYHGTNQTLTLIGVRVTTGSGSASAAGDLKIQLRRNTKDNASQHTAGSGTLVKEVTAFSTAGASGALYARSVETFFTDVSITTDQVYYAEVSSAGFWAFTDFVVEWIFRVG